MSKYLVTSALPYANGKLHAGHVAGAYLPADIYVRYLRLKKEDGIYICGTDDHGAPISIAAEARGISPAQLVQENHASIKQSFDGLGIKFDNFSGTSRPEHHQLAQQFFISLLYREYIHTKVTMQLYCEHDKRYLADRYVEGVCPHCSAEGARGDQCDSCGHLIDATTLITPQCKICGNTPVARETKHWFLDLPKFEPQLKEWLASKTDWKDNVHNFISSWLDNGLIERAITRDIDWGVKLPIKEGEGKVLYVWFDAPIGYISSTKEWAKEIGQPDKWKDYWLDKETKLIHFIGKDNIPFHTIIWPAMLMQQQEDYVLPHDVPANEYLSLEGKKISTSKNYALWVEDYLADFDGELLRYVLAANAPETKDADFTWKEFQSRVNTDLANILGNLAHRVLTFATRYFEGALHKPDNYSKPSQLVFLEASRIREDIDEAYRTFKVRKAAKLIMDLARLGNKYFDEQKPWAAIKENPAAAEESLFVCTQLLRYISIAFSPIMPQTVLKLRAMLGLGADFAWDTMQKSPAVYQLGDIHTLFDKIEDETMEVQAEKLALSLRQEKIVEIKPKENITFDQFMGMELRIVKVIAAEKIKKSKKLLKLTVEMGNVKKTVLSGIAAHYKAGDLIGKKVVMLVNLPSRAMMGEVSEGMILAAEEDGVLSVLVPEASNVPSGSPIS